MQAANPGCELEDFVRWYSPRDWVEDEEEEEEEEKEEDATEQDATEQDEMEEEGCRRRIKGCLSQRMLVSHHSQGVISLILSKNSKSALN